LPATGSDHTESILLAALLAGSGYALVRATRRKGSTLSN
jgi:LPXTG-motif cell wall-anchored protein